MAMSPERNSIGIELQELLRERDLKQVELARYLELTPAAVSQFFHGKTLPSPRQFERMLEFLRPRPEKVNFLVRCFSIARQGGTLEQSDFNRNLLARRCFQGMSRERLSALSGIAQERLERLEKSPETAPDGSEIEKLSGLLKCTPGELLGGTTPQAFPAPAAELEVAEKFSPTENRLAVLTLHDLAFYQENEDFALFVSQRSATYQAHRYIPGAVALLTVSATKLKLHPQAQVTLVLGNSGKKRRGGLFLGRGRRGGYVLWEQVQKGQWEILAGLSNFNRVNTAVWRLPVLEMIFQPDSTSGKE